MRHGLLIYNPAAGGHAHAERMREIVARARRSGVTLEERITTGPGSATEIVAASLASAPDLIVIAGGDGSIREAATALVGSETPLAILPYGTGNVLAREYGIGTNPERAEQLLTSRATRRLTAWRAGDGVCFMWMGAGFDARMLKRTVPALKRSFGRVGIGWTAAIEFARHDLPSLAVEGIDADGRAFTREATFAVAANIKRYGGDMMLAPDADPEDDLLDVTLFTGRGRVGFARLFARIALGQMARINDSDIRQIRARSFSVRSTGTKPVEVQIDGDDAGFTPATIGPVAGYVRIVVAE